MNAPDILPIITTISGGMFDLRAPRPADINIRDIAHSLSHICRFTGHVRKFYSVAQHSVLVSMLVPLEHAMYGLLHDASEAYLGDVATPLKRLLPEYAELETVCMEAVLRRFCLPTCIPSSVRRADLIMLATEKRDLLDGAGGEWAVLDGVRPVQDVIRPMSPLRARIAFLNRFHELSGRPW